VTAKSYLDVEDLEVYKKLCQLHIEVCDLIHTWPQEEMFELGSQVRRPSKSSASQLAEKNDDQHIRTLKKRNKDEINVKGPDIRVFTTLAVTTKERPKMAKEKVKHLGGVFASVFAHHGHITKEEAKEISGLEDHEFENAYDKASNIADKVMQHEGEKMDKFLEHFAKEIDKYFDHYGGKLFK
jgi:hypothetical protein